MTETPVGLTKDAGYQIGVSRTIAAPIEQIWDYLTSAKGVGVWLGDLPGAIPQTPGTGGETFDGTRFEIRSFRPHDRLRLVWQPAGEEERTLQLAVRSLDSDRTTLRFHQERMASGAERERRRAHWKTVMAQVVHDLGV